MILSHGRGLRADRAGAGPVVRSHRHRSRTPHRQPARRNAQLSASGHDPGDHGLPALAPAAACRSGTSLAARMRAGGVRKRVGGRQSASLRSAV